MKNFEVVGSSPIGADCVQVERGGDYLEAMLKECGRYKAMLEKMFPPAHGCRFSVKTFEHDFGTYAEVVVNYDDSNEAAEEFALNVINNQPETWEGEAQ
jgi:hypothetical protein